jgi:hypothetical protein
MALEKFQLVRAGVRLRLRISARVRVRVRLGR